MSVRAKEGGVKGFFADKNVLITGGSGFLGKLLVCKLLTSCPDLGRVHLLLRPKRAKKKNRRRRRGTGKEEEEKEDKLLSPDQRLAQIIRSPVFSLLRESRPESLKKIGAVNGDLTKPGLALRPADRERLVGEVDVIFHLAASVKFDDPLSAAWSANVDGTRRMLRLAEEAHAQGRRRRSGRRGGGGGLSAFVHVSTAFAHCKVDGGGEAVEAVIEERMYPEEELLKFAKVQVESHPEEGLCGRPNAYTYSKAAAEQLLLQHRQVQLRRRQQQQQQQQQQQHQVQPLLPLVVVRPSIVAATWKDPFPGWVENFNGATGMMACLGTGVLRTLRARGDARADLVPADAVANLVCVAAYRVAGEQEAEEEEDRTGGGRRRTRRRRRSRKRFFWQCSLQDGQKCRRIPVFHITSGQKNPLTWRELTAHVESWLPVFPMARMGRFPGVTINHSEWKDWIYRLSLHWFCGCVFDLFLRRLRGRRPFLRALYRRVDRAAEALLFFATREWTWTGSEAEEMRADLHGEEDREEFDFDISSLDWRSYFGPYVLGVRNFVLGDSNRDLAESRRIYRAWQVVDRLQRLFWIVLASSLICYWITLLF